MSAEAWAERAVPCAASDAAPRYSTRATRASAMSRGATSATSDCQVPSVSACDALGQAQPASKPAHSGACTSAAAAGTAPHGAAAAGVPAHMAHLTADQRSELAMAARRAQKAAMGKRARGLSTLLDGPDRDGNDDDLDIQKHSEEIEAKIAGMEDEKEAKRLKRLLRNRISAQQARERKKSYVQSLEAKAQEAEDCTVQLQVRVQQLESENKVLRTLIKNLSANQQADNKVQLLQE